MNFLYPVPPNSPVTQTFAEHVAAAIAHGWQFYNGGIDWAVPTGTPIKSAQKGKVTELRTDATGYGTHVRVQHADGYLTIYGHMSGFSVNVGDEVEAGNVLGPSDNTGNSTGPHLHFELRHNNKPIDPMPLLVTQLGPGAGSGAGAGAGTGTGTVTEIDAPTEFPQLPKASITAVALNIRMGPGVANPTVGLIPQGNVVDVIDAVKQGNDIWLRIGYQQYIAMKFAGDSYAVWVEA